MDCFQIYNELEIKFNKIIEKLKINLPEFLPAYLFSLANSNKNWEIAKINLEENECSKDCENQDLNSDEYGKYFIMRPRKIFKISKRIMSTQSN